MRLEHDLSKTPSLKQQAYDILLDMITSGELKPGMRLTEEGLSKMLNISRAPIREALNMLERDGFTKIIPRCGTIVTNISKNDLMDVWKCRLALEPFAAREATPYIPKEELTNCLIDLNKLESEPYDYNKYVASDLEVHDLYCRHLKNTYMQSFLNKLNIHSARLRWFNELQPDSIDLTHDAIQEHKEIILAFLSRDPEAVYDAMHKHIQNSYTRLISTFPEEEQKEQ